MNAFRGVLIAYLTITGFALFLTALLTGNPWWMLGPAISCIAVTWLVYCGYQPDDGYDTTVYGPRETWGQMGDFEDWETELRATHPDNGGWSHG